MSQFQYLDRRAFLLGIAAAVAARAASSQTPSKVPRAIIYTSRPAWHENVVVALRELGWSDGQSVALEWRRGGEEQEEVKELAKLHVDVAVVAGPKRIADAMKATRTVPIVGVDLESDPVASGSTYRSLRGSSFSSCERSSPTSAA